MLDTISEKVRSQDKINSALAKEILGDIEGYPCTQNSEPKNIEDKISKMFDETHETLNWVGQILEQIVFI